MMKRKMMTSVLAALLCAVMLCGTASAVELPDLPASNWAYHYAETMVELGIMELDGQGNFNPDVPTNRGEFVTALWRAFGGVELEVSKPTFSDVGREDDCFYAVEWAYVAEITTGDGNGSFIPDASLTREMAFTFLYRAMDFIGVAPQFDDGHISPKMVWEFDDYWDLSAWAESSVQLLLDIGIVTGTDTNELWPKFDVNNVATATILYKFLDEVGIFDDGTPLPEESGYSGRWYLNADKGDYSLTIDMDASTWELRNGIGENGDDLGLIIAEGDCETNMFDELLLYDKETNATVAMIGYEPGDDDFELILEDDWAWLIDSPAACLIFYRASISQ